MPSARSRALDKVGMASPSARTTTSIPFARNRSAPSFGRSGIRRSGSKAAGTTGHTVRWTSPCRIVRRDEAMKFPITLKTLIDGRVQARSFSSLLGEVTVAGADKDDAVQRMEKEIRYRLEWCP